MRDSPVGENHIFMSICVTPPSGTVLWAPPEPVLLIVVVMFACPDAVAF
jgi:hypothetical protein